MYLFIATCLALLVILAGMHYMAKVKAENLGPFYKWVGYLVLLAAACVLMGLIFKGVRRVLRHDKGYYMQSMQKGRQADHRMMKGKNMHMGSSGMQCCGMNGMQMRKGHMGMKGGNCCCCDMCMMDMDDTTVTREFTTDTIDGKIVKKQMRKIEMKE